MVKRWVRYGAFMTAFAFVFVSKQCVEVFCTINPQIFFCIDPGDDGIFE